VSVRLLLAAVAFSIVVPVRSALAHPKLVSASPSANSTVPQSPVTISATFNESLTPALSKLTLVDATQRVIPLDSVRAAEGDSKTITARVSATLKPGRYTVKWQAAGADGHPMKGEFTFLVATPGGGGELQGVR